MSSIKQYLFNNPAEYAGSNAEISVDKGILSLVPKTGIAFTQDFSSSSGFSFDSDLVEFVAGVLRQKDQRPAGATFGANYNANINGNFGGGALAGVAFGGAEVLNGQLDLAHDDIRHVTYDAVGNFDNPQTGSIKFKFTPPYSNNPTSNICIFSSGRYFTNNQNHMFMTQGTNGILYLKVYDKNSALTLSSGFDPWSPIAGEQYEFSLDFDFTAGVTELRINGIQQGSTATSTVERDSNISFLRIGSDRSNLYKSNFKIDDLICYGSVQHTEDYTPGYTVSDAGYLKSVVNLPSFPYTGVGFLQVFETFAATCSANTRFIIDGDYWNGSAWALSDGTYTQSSTAAQVTTNITTLDNAGSSEISLDVTFPDSSTQENISNVIITATGQKRSPIGSLITDEPVISIDLIYFLASATTPAGTQVKFIMIGNGVGYWHNGTAWVVSTDDETQSNTMTEVQEFGVGFITDNTEFKIKTVLITTDDNETPEINTITIEYEFGALAPTSAEKSYVYGFIEDIEGIAIENCTIKVRPAKAAKYYKEAASRIIGFEKSKTSDNEGFFYFELIRSSEYEGTGLYEIEITFPDETEMTKNGTLDITFLVPDQVQTNITSVIEEAMV